MIYLSYFLQTYSRSIWGQVFINFFSPVDVSLGRSDSFVLSLIARPFLVLVGKEYSHPIKLTPSLYRGWNLTLYYCFKVSSPTPWPLLRSLGCPLYFGVSDVFKGNTKLSINLMVLSALTFLRVLFQSSHRYPLLLQGYVFSLGLT